MDEARYRESLTQPTPLKPGQVYRLEAYPALLALPGCTMPVLPSTRDGDQDPHDPYERLLAPRRSSSALALAFLSQKLPLPCNNSLLTSAVMSSGGGIDENPSQCERKTIELSLFDLDQRPAGWQDATKRRSRMAAMTRREFVKHATTDLAVAECLAARAARADLTKESVAFLKTLKA